MRKGKQKEAPDRSVAHEGESRKQRRQNACEKLTCSEGGSRTEKASTRRAGRARRKCGRAEVGREKGASARWNAGGRCVSPRNGAVSIGARESTMRHV